MSAVVVMPLMVIVPAPPVKVQVWLEGWVLMLKLYVAPTTK